MALFSKRVKQNVLEEARSQGIDLERLPRHVAIIMDGNGRWGVKHRGVRSLGHRAGVEALRAIIRESSDLGIEALSIYAFSTENWSRPREEVSVLMSLLMEFFGKEIDELHENGVCIRILGDVDGMPEPQRGALKAAMDKTRDNSGLRLNIALNYGSRMELVRAARLLAQRVKQGEIAVEDIDEAAFAQSLYTHDLPDVDLLIRTSGEMRLSNFMLYQCSYAEFVVVDTLWPDFDLHEYLKTIAIYQSRDRRFGGVKA